MVLCREAWVVEGGAPFLQFVVEKEDLVCGRLCIQLMVGGVFTVV